MMIPRKLWPLRYWWHRETCCLYTIRRDHAENFARDEDKLAYGIERRKLKIND